MAARALWRPSEERIANANLTAFMREVNERFEMELSSQDYDTIGGFIFGTLGRLPVKGDKVSVEGSGELTVVDTEDRRVTRVKVVPYRRRKQRESESDEQTEDEAVAAEEES